MPYRPQKVHFRALGGIFRLAHCPACSVFGLHLRNQAVIAECKKRNDHLDSLGSTHKKREIETID